MTGFTSPLRMMWTRPSPSRIFVVRNSIASTTPLAAADFDDVSDQVRVFEQDEEARHHVVDQRLGAEADHQAEDARAGQKRHRVEAERARISTAAAKYTP